MDPTTSSTRAPDAGRRAPRSIRRDLRLCTLDGTGYSVMVGVGETYFVLFVLALGAGEALAGLAATLPRVVGGVLQLLSPWAVGRIGSNRAWVVGCAFVQSLSFAPLVIGAASGWMPVWAAFVAIGVYWTSGLATGPAWNSWVTTLVPARVRAAYFARRWRPLQLGTLAGLVAGGLILEFGDGDRHLWLFAVLFGVAGLMRFGSTFCLAAQSEPARPARLVQGGLGSMVRDAARGPGGRLLLFMLCVQVSVQVSGPYFAPFMKRDLAMGYGEFMVLISTAYVAKSVSVPLTGRIIRRVGPYAVLWAGGIGIIPTAGLWVVSHDFWFLLGVQVLAGLVWGCYEIATFLLLFETIPVERRIRVLTVFNLADSLMIVLGSLAGAQILHAMDESVEGFHALFLISSVLRVVCLVMLARVRPLRVPAGRVVLRSLGARLNAVPEENPIVASMERQDRAMAERERAIESRGVGDST